MAKSRLAAYTNWTLPRTDATDATPLARTPEEQVTLWFRDHAEGIYRFLTGVYGCEADCEEATQEAFLRLYEALHAGERIDNPRAWVFLVARRRVLNRIKGAQYDAVKCRELAHVSRRRGRRADAPDARLDARQRIAALRRGYQELSPIEKDCLKMRAQGMKLREIGDVLRMDLRRVAELLNRVIARLQRHVRG